MDRRLADRNVRVGLGYAGIALGIFALTFVVALLYIR
jgi:hypothetical protein